MKNLERFRKQIQQAKKSGAPRLTFDTQYLNSVLEDIDRLGKTETVYRVPNDIRVSGEKF